jgi:hypothetical protein
VANSLDDHKLLDIAFSSTVNRVMQYHPSVLHRMSHDKLHHAYRPNLPLG